MLKKTLLLMAIASLTISAHADTLVGKTLYGPYVETWNDSLHHERGTHQARHLTAEGQAWVEQLKSVGYTELEVKGCLFTAFSNGNKIPAELPAHNPPVDSEPDEDRLVSGQDSSSQTVVRSNLRTIKASVIGAFDKADTKMLFQMMLDKDQDGLRDMYQHGKCIPLDEGTQVYLVDVDIFAGWNKVRSKGSSQEVWVPKEFLQ